MKWMCAAVIALSQLTEIGYAADVKDAQWSIRVNVYRNFSGSDFEPLTELGSLVAKEASNGFLLKSVITRNGFHQGATFCLLVNPNLGDASEEKARILAAIEALKSQGSFDDFSISSPSSCMIEI
jgi:hypothetical protein